ncbi:CHASE2 domain-containing serine/threonine-protein kinase [Parachitinimonas caeni]|uniref:Serine/threonine-protein kinase n=1 Tax=Parachitinimonas caeni TaxID=3031301 RepID=A0ABT7DT16_9NEIS|nr:serine/threonine-protein kinase [Parachitinimonas caeni]MDK2123213.1 serine/threonine-protein kinase [Parachitinimonas caeni]
MKKGFWKSDWFVGIVMLLIFAIIQFGTGLLNALENKAYDVGMKLANRVPNDRIAIIAIDEQSIANIGRWPWSRDVHAQFLDKLSAAKPKLIANTVLFTEPQQDKGTVYINQLLDLYRKSKANGAEAGSPEYEQFGKLLEDASDKLNFDKQLARSIGQAKNVLLPMVFDRGEPQGNPDAPTPDYVLKNQINVAGADSGSLPYPTVRFLAPLQQFGTQAKALGALNVVPDQADGIVRQEALALRYYDQTYPSLALAVAAKSLNLDLKQVTFTGEVMQLGGLQVATGPNALMASYFYPDRDGKPAFSADSFYDVASGKIPVSKYQDKIVLIGATAPGIGSTFVTPVSATTTPAVYLAHAVSDILQGHYVKLPNWAGWLSILMIALVAAYLIGLLPRLKAAQGAAITGGVFAVLVSADIGMMAIQLTHLPLMEAATLLLFGHLLLTTKRFLMTERGKEASELSAAESNRMLGLAFQGQGQLDMAFDKFRKVPMDDSMMELLYNLALDFERKRQFNKAEMVYRHMADFNPKYKDLEQKMTRSKQMAETVMLGGGSTRSNASTLVLEGGAIEKPMLGRYQVEKELGKGAMGVVYLGRDPKIGREVAIKTMALSQEFEAEELQDARERFFREAAAAGKLDHPNIVKIYDVGEEHDLAYIAMEFLKGKDLAPYTKAGHLLPIPEVMKIVYDVAEALNEAHAMNIVHRDIKPANIMYETDTKKTKVTDFGVARITDSSKTKTGMVLGTPSYMSPEQLSGKKIDGRSDLFSLGVMLYQMTVGTLPFQGESMAELMFRIANEPYRNPKELNPNLPDCLVAVIDKALKKNAEERFQTGAEFAQALRKCAVSLKG